MKTNIFRKNSLLQSMTFKYEFRLKIIVLTTVIIMPI